MLINNQGEFYCPLCKRFFQGRPYLSTVFSDERPLWLSNMVTHYRHNHINYYNRWVHYHSRYRSYESFKAKVNNRAKRNIIKKCKEFLKDHHFTVNDFAALQNTDEKTLKLAGKILGGKSTGKNRGGSPLITLDDFVD
jgi:hypothetical protein